MDQRRNHKDNQKILKKTNENENTTYQNLQDKVKSGAKRGNFQVQLFTLRNKEGLESTTGFYKEQKKELNLKPAE